MDQATTPLELHARLRRDAQATAISLETQSEPALPGYVSDRLIATGPQAAIIAFADRVEARAPAARFTSWVIEGHPAGVRLRAVVVARGADK